jgi:site-specific DNA-methyltransferase (adenine-specific)
VTDLDWRIIEGDCRDVLAELDADSVDAIVTDPPYHLTQLSRGGSPRMNDPATPFGRHRLADRGFMGQTWDGGDIAQRVDLWEALLRVLKPGGYLLAFGGTRTAHRMMCAIEDAGFRIQDTIAWIHAQGFPKGPQQLKPAFEPITVAYKPGPRVLQIDAARIGTEYITAQGGGRNDRLRIYGNGKGIPAIEAGSNPHFGRWPANVALDECAAQLLDGMSGASRSQSSMRGVRYRGIYGPDTGPSGPDTLRGYDDAGGASRFFYTAKASRAERDLGLESLPLQDRDIFGDDEWGRRERAIAPSRNTHPTVKPLSLMQWLVRLVTPPGGVILDPFMGSGTTGLAAIRQGFAFVGIEREPEYIEQARGRFEGQIRRGWQLDLLA